VISVSSRAAGEFANYDSPPFDLAWPFDR